MNRCYTLPHKEEGERFPTRPRARPSMSSKLPPAVCISVPNAMYHYHILGAMVLNTIRVHGPTPVSALVVSCILITETGKYPDNL